MLPRWGSCAKGVIAHSQVICPTASPFRRLLIRCHAAPQSDGSAEHRPCPGPRDRTCSREQGQPVSPQPPPGRRCHPHGTQPDPSRRCGAGWGAGRDQVSLLECSVLKTRCFLPGGLINTQRGWLVTHELHRRALQVLPAWRNPAARHWKRERKSQAIRVCNRELARTQQEVLSTVGRALGVPHEMLM